MQLNKIGSYTLEKEIMNDSTIACKLCKIPLTHQEQFIGHMIHSHEVKSEEAAYMWQMTRSRLQEPLLAPNEANEE